MSDYYNPEKYLESSVRILKDYLEMEFQKAVNDGQSYVGSSAYEVIAEFPGSAMDTGQMPMHKTIIHFEIDDIQSDVIGFGPGITVDDTFDPDTGMISVRTGEVILLNIDIGIWATDAAGGATSRMRAKQILQWALGGVNGVIKLKNFSDGGDGMLEIVGYSGGRFVMDRINDMQVFRMIENTLVVRVYSRVPLEDWMTGPAIQEFVQDPTIWIRDDDGNLISIE